MEVPEWMKEALAGIKWGNQFIVVLCIEGGIGSGKSTFIDLVMDWASRVDLGFEIVPCIEPLAAWQKHITTEAGESLGKGHLDFFYADMKKRGFSFQVVAISSRLIAFREAYSKAEEIARTGKRVVVLAERSNISDQLFAETNYQSGTIDDVNMDAYRYYVRQALRVDEQPISCHIYIRPDLSQCIEWRNKRGRSCENDIPIDYLRMLEKKHDETFVEKNKVAVTMYVNEDASEADRGQRCVLEMLRAVKRVVSPDNKCTCCLNSVSCPELLQLDRFVHKEEILRRSVDVE